MSLRSPDALLKLSRCFSKVDSHRSLSRAILASGSPCTETAFCSAFNNPTDASVTQLWLPPGSTAAQHSCPTSNHQYHQYHTESASLARLHSASTTPSLAAAARTRCATHSSAQRACSTTAATSTSPRPTSRATTPPPPRQTTHGAPHSNITYPRIQAWASQASAGKQLVKPSAEERLHVATLLHAFHRSKAVQNAAQKLYINAQVSVSAGAAWPRVMVAGPTGETVACREVPLAVGVPAPPDQPWLSYVCVARPSPAYAGLLPAAERVLAGCCWCCHAKQACPLHPPAPLPTRMLPSLLSHCCRELAPSIPAPPPRSSTPA